MTIELTNPIFFRFAKMPEGITSENFKNEADPVFEEGMDLINEGKTEEGFAAFSKLLESLDHQISGEFEYNH
ncbi:MAG: hypothetical protein GYB39_09970 [Algicola sp.]|nr:hypothetical protein [Algicola sp.]